MRIAFFAPLPPEVSGIADYSAELLPFLARLVSVDVYTGGGSVSSNQDLWNNVRVFDYCKFSSLRGIYDLSIYQLGSGKEWAVEIYKMLMHFPGLTVLHDLNLSGLFGSMTFGQGKSKLFLWELCRQEGLGAFLRATYTFVQTRRMPGQHDFWMNRRVVNCSKGIVVHNAWAKTWLRQNMGRSQVPIWQINHGIPLPSLPSPAEVQKFKHDLILDSYDIVIGSFGTVDESKCFSSSLAAFRQLLDKVPNALYLFVGAYQPQHLHQIGKMGLNGHVRMTGRVDKAAFYKYIAATDVCVNLRSQTKGEASGPLLRVMSLGKPVAVSDYAQFAELPDQICCKVAIGQEEMDLSAWMLRLVQSPEIRQDLGQKARQHIESFHSLDQSARGYVAVFYEYLNLYGKSGGK